jgi:hypothetical protein
VMFSESLVVILMKNYFIQIYGCNIVRVLLHRYKWRIFLCRKVMLFGSLDAIMLNL